jgi:predicted amidohydrolase YtcJ
MFANQLAMELSGITDSTDNPNGGVIVRDGLGKAIGVFEEEAELLIQKSLDNYLSKRTEKEVQDDLIKEIDKATEECIKYGITSFHDAGSTFDEIDLYKKLADDNYFKVRLYLMLGESNEMLNKKMSDYRMIGYGNNFLTVRAIKKYSDGALGSRGAWLLEPYDDLKYKIVDGDTSEYVGQSVTPLSELEETANLAVKNGFQLCTHAIGDKANREVLNLYEKFISQNQSNELRWRIEHAQHLNEKDIPRFSRLGVIAAMQPVHCTSDAVFVPKRLGNQRAEEGAYVWRNLLDANAVICSGTDAPVEKVNPFENIYSAVTRKSKDGTVFYPEQRMTREEALKSYTLNGAYAAFEEKIKGSITKGKLADIVVLSNDLMDCSEDEILSTEVLYTVVGGKIVYQKPESEE